MRLFRIFKLATSWIKLRNLLIAIGVTIGAIKDFLVLVLLFTLVATLVGMEFFAYYIRFMPDGEVSINLADGQSPRTNFDTLLDAMIAVFGLFTNENWNGVMYEHMKGLNSWLPLGYFVVVMVVGNFLLMKLFVSLLIFNFCETAEKLMLEYEE